MIRKNFRMLDLMAPAVFDFTLIRAEFDVVTRLFCALAYREKQNYDESSNSIDPRFPDPFLLAHPDHSAVLRRFEALEAHASPDKNNIQLCTLLAEVGNRSGFVLVKSHAYAILYPANIMSISQYLSCEIISFKSNVNYMRHSVSEKDKAEFFHRIDVYDWRDRNIYEQDVFDFSGWRYVEADSANGARFNQSGDPAWFEYPTYYKRKNICDRLNKHILMEYLKSVLSPAFPDVGKAGIDRALLITSDETDQRLPYDQLEVDRLDHFMN